MAGVSGNVSTKRSQEREDPSGERGNARRPVCGRLREERASKRGGPGQRPGLYVPGHQGLRQGVGFGDWSLRDRAEWRDARRRRLARTREWIPRPTSGFVFALPHLEGRTAIDTETILS